MEAELAALIGSPADKVRTRTSEARAYAGTPVMKLRA